MVLARANALVNSVVQLHARRPLRQADIQQATGLQLRAVQQAVQQLEKRGALRRARLAGSTVYHPTTEGPVGSALRSLALSEIDLSSPAGDELDRVRTVAVIGSIARGTERSSSDLDLLIVGKPDREALRSIFTQLEHRYGRRVDAVILTTDDLRTRQEEDDPYIKTALAEAVVLTGREL